MEHGSRHFPNKFRKYRKLSGYSQQEVAWLIGHRTTSRLSRWERGAGKPSVENLYKLSVLYKTLMEVLCGDSCKEARKEIIDRIKRISTNE